MKCLLSIEISSFFFFTCDKMNKTYLLLYSVQELQHPHYTSKHTDSWWFTKQVLPTVLQMRNQYPRTFLILDLSSIQIVKTKEEIYTVKITSSNSIFQIIFWVFHDGLDVFPVACFCRKDVERCFHSFSLSLCGSKTVTKHLEQTNSIRHNNHTWRHALV